MPVVVVRNRSRRDHVFIMSGEVITGGKQTRTVRQDVVLAPREGDRAEGLLCRGPAVGGRRKSSRPARPWCPSRSRRNSAAGPTSSASGRKWPGTTRSLSAENATGSLERALKSAPVQEKLPRGPPPDRAQHPQGTMGFIFVDRHRNRAVGADFFGSEDLARELLPKLLESYAVDLIVIRKDGATTSAATTATARPSTSSSGSAAPAAREPKRPAPEPASAPAAGGLLGDGVSLGGVLVHYGVQTEDRIVPQPSPKPIIIFPEPRQQRR